MKLEHEIYLPNALAIQDTSAPSCSGTYEGI